MSWYGQPWKEISGHLVIGHFVWKVVTCLQFQTLKASAITMKFSEFIIVLTGVFDWFHSGKKKIAHLIAFTVYCTLPCFTIISSSFPFPFSGQYQACRWACTKSNLFNKDKVSGILSWPSVRVVTYYYNDIMIFFPRFITGIAFLEGCR